MLNCSNANKIQCRPDLFGAWFWECGFVADLSHSRLPHRLCLLILPIPSNAWLVLDSVLDYFIVPGVISSWVLTPFLTDAKCNKLLFKWWIVGSWTLLRRLLEERWNIFKWPSRKSSYPHIERLGWPGWLESIGCLYTRYNLTFIGVCLLLVCRWFFRSTCSASLELIWMDGYHILCPQKSPSIGFHRSPDLLGGRMEIHLVSF